MRLFIEIIDYREYIASFNIYFLLSIIANLKQQT